VGFVMLLGYCFVAKCLGFYQSVGN
jgi:hypothetical protein